MVSTDIENYEVLSILGTHINSTCYKVKNKNTSEIYVWKAITYDSVSQEENESFFRQLDERKSVEHPNILKIHGYILYKESKVVYLITDFCKAGNYRHIIQKCINKDERISEDFIWYSLYHIACAIKTIKLDQFTLSLEDIFLDDENNIQLFIMPAASETNDDNKSDVFYLGKLIYQLCTLSLDLHDDTDYSIIPKYYSDSLHDIITFILQKNVCLQRTVDAILCHPTVLLQSAQVNKNEIFIAKPYLQNANNIADNIINNKIETLCNNNSEAISKREATLKLHEEKLSAREHDLHKRERKVALMERIVKEKFQRAELYLKRCRQVKSINSNGVPLKNKVSYDNLDTSFSADCGDTSILPTSKKLNTADIIKPPVFSRTMSERRVRFRGHSPLKDIRNKFNSNQEQRAAKLYDCHPVLINSHLTHSDKSSEASSSLDKLSETNFEKTLNKEKLKKRSLFSLFPTKNKTSSKSSLNQKLDLVNNLDDVRKDFRPISWSEENKRQAFELLRIINSEEQKENCVPVKHTCL